MACLACPLSMTTCAKHCFLLTALLSSYLLSVLEDIIQFYCANIRIILEYGAPVWHFSISQQHSRSIEGIQRRVIKTIEKIPIHNHDYGYEHLLRKYGLDTLQHRRVTLCERQLSKIPPSLFKKIPSRPERTRTLRKSVMSLKCRTWRYQRSFLPSSIRHFL